MSTKRVRLNSGSGPLIPGLPDDVATLCLVRVPFHAHASCERVSKGWHSIFKTNRSFSAHRRAFGLQDPWLVVFAVDRHTEKIHVRVLNLTTLSWHTEHVNPDLYYGRGAHFRSVSIPHEGVVYAFGGIACCGSRVNVFLKYEAREENRWTVIKATTGRIGLFTAGVVDGKVYVTGLGKELSDGEHEPVEVFDPKKGTWKPVPNHAAHSGDFRSATAFDGKLLLTYYDEFKRGLIYDPRTDEWEYMAAQLSEGLGGGFAVEAHGHLFVLALGRLRVYDDKSDSWDVVEGDALPGLMISNVVSLVSRGDGKIYAVKDSFGVYVGDISTTEGKCSRFRVRWKMVVDRPPSGVNLQTLCAQVLC